MKTPSAIFIFTVVAAALAVVSCASFCGDKLFCITIGKSGHYVPIKNKSKFDAALLALGEGNYDIYYKKDDASAPVHPYHPPRVSLKTDRVTTSELAQNEPAGDPHVTQYLTSNSLDQIEKVLDTLEK